MNRCIAALYGAVVSSAVVLMIWPAAARGLDPAERCVSKKSYGDGSIHDVANDYHWNNLTLIHVATLNAGNFAGHDDWRVPTVKEMVSLFNFSSTADAKGYPEFDLNCDPMGNPSFTRWGIHPSTAMS